MPRRHHLFLFLSFLGALLGESRLRAQDDEPASYVVNQYQITHWYDARPTDARVLMLGPRGRIWLGLGDGTIRILEDQDKNGFVDEEEAKVFVAGTWAPHGLAWQPNGRGHDVFVCHTMAEFGGIGQITCFTDEDGDDTFESVRSVILNLPPGAHQVNNIALDPERRWLYFSQGATADTSPGGGALVGRVPSSAKDLRWGDPRIEIVATGLRNAWGLAFHPSGALFATDNGRDDLGETEPPDELNLILPGKHYGFPEVSGQPPPGHSSEAPVALLPVHASANGLTFDQGRLLSGFEHQVFIACWGSWKGAPGEDAGTGILQGQLHLDASGRWQFRGHHLVTRCGRPLDAKMGPAGELFFSLQNSGPGWGEGVYRLVPRHGVSLRIEGLPAPGQRLSLRVRAPGQPGRAYQVGLAWGQGPIRTPLGDLGLAADDLLRSSLKPSPFIRIQRPGTLDASGLSSGPDTLLIPEGLSGRTFYLAAVTADPKTGALTGISPTVPVTIL